jgi:hypothetical protein
MCDQHAWATLLRLGILLGSSKVLLLQYMPTSAIFTGPSLFFFQNYVFVVRSLRKPPVVFPHKKEGAL